MTEHEVITFLCVCIGIMGFVLIGLDRMNDKLQEENKRLQQRIREYEAEAARKGGRK